MKYARSKYNCVVTKLEQYCHNLVKRGQGHWSMAKGLSWSHLILIKSFMFCTVFIYCGLMFATYKPALNNIVLQFMKN